MGLLLLARGIQRRLSGAYWITAILLGVGIAASLFKGLDFEEALFLGALLAALLPNRRFFLPAYLPALPALYPGLDRGHRHDRHQRFLAGIFLIQTRGIPGSLMVAIRLQCRCPPLSACLGRGCGGSALLFAVARLLRPAHHRPGPAGEEEMQTVVRIVGNANETTANLALLGDKSFLISPQKNAFIMYGVQGRSWVAMGDPVGPQDAWPELIWHFREQSDRFGGWALFYQVTPDGLPYYLDLGLTLTKLGETARVPLADFSLEGSHRKGLRYTRRKMVKEGLSMEILPADQAMARFDALKQISDAWLTEKNTSEKGFSLGRFSEEYLRWFDMAVVSKNDSIVAFANLWKGADNAELSIDLMRYNPSLAPGGVMDYLFIELMLWGRGKGVRMVRSGHGAAVRSGRSIPGAPLEPPGRISGASRRTLLQLRRAAPVQG